VKYKGGFKINKNFIGLIIPYASVLLLPILIWLISNVYVIHNNETKWISLLTSNIENNIRVIDSDLDQIENMVDSISQNGGFSKFFSGRKLTFEELVNSKKMLGSYLSESRYIDDLYIYCKKSGYLINTESIYYDAKDYYKTRRPIVGYTAESWNEELESGKNNGGYSEQTEYADNSRYVRVLQYRRNVPIYNFKKNDGNITTLINADKLLSYFDVLLEKGSGEIYVYNTKGELLLEKGDKYRDESYSFNADGHKKVCIGKDKMYRFDVISEKNKWRYTVFINQEYVLSEVSGFNTLLNTISIIAFLLGACMCLYFTYKKNEACLQVIKLLGIDGTDFFSKKLSINEFEILKPFLGQVLEENNTLKVSMEKMGKMVDYKALHTILYGNIENEDTLLDIMKDSNLSFSKKKFMVLVLSSKVLYNIEGEKNKKLFLMNTLEEFINEESYIYVADAKTMVMLINFDEDASEFCDSLRRSCAKMNTDVFFRYHMDVILGAGNVTESLFGISDSFKQALRVVSYNGLIGQKEILFSDELPDENIVHYYPIELEDKIIKNISCGNSSEAMRILDIVYDENISKRNLSGEQLEELIREVNCSINRVKQLYFEDDESIDYKIIGFTVKSFFEYVRDFIFSACESIKNFDENNLSEKFKNIIKYINEHYSDYDLSLGTLAEAFELNDITYISKQFKRITNENFSSYLERIRIEKACEMLDEKHQIKEIAKQVGYLSDVSFRRAFKKRMGISPRDYTKCR